MGVGIGVGVGAGVGVGLGVSVSVGLGIGVGVGVAVGSGVGVAVGVGSRFGVEVGVTVISGVGLMVGVEVGVGTGVSVRVEVGVGSDRAHAVPIVASSTNRPRMKYRVPPFRGRFSHFTTLNLKMGTTPDKKHDTRSSTMWQALLSRGLKTPYEFSRKVAKVDKCSTFVYR